jgi:hypothetical protein
MMNTKFGFSPGGPSSAQHALPQQADRSASNVPNNKQTAE